VTWYQSVTSVKVRNVPHIATLLNYKESKPSENKKTNKYIHT